MSKSVFQQQYEDENSSDKLSRKAKDSPFMIIGKFIALLRHIDKIVIAIGDIASLRNTSAICMCIQVVCGADLDTEFQTKFSCCVTYHIFFCLHHEATTTNCSVDHTIGYFWTEWLSYSVKKYMTNERTRLNCCNIQYSLLLSWVRSTSFLCNLDLNSFASYYTKLWFSI